MSSGSVAPEVDGRAATRRSAAETRLHAIWTSSPLAVALWFLLLGLFGIKRLYRIKLHGFEVWVRSGTPDLRVAASTLGREFNGVITASAPPPGAVIIDAGGYIGTAAMKFAAAFPSCTIVTIEPAPDNLAILRRNVEGIANIVVVEAALAAASGTAALHDPGALEWGYTLSRGARRGTRVCATVRTTTLADVLATQATGPVVVLKLDVEGAERDVLASSEGWMDRVELVLAELHPHLAPDVAEVFKTATTGRTNGRLPGEKVYSRHANAGHVALGPLKTAL